MSRRFYDYDPLFGPLPRRRAAPEPHLRAIAPDPEQAPVSEPPLASPAEAAPPDKQDLRAALSELQNAKARVDRDAERVLVETRQNLVRDLLPILDNLDRSIAAGDTTDPEARAVLDGVHLVRAQFEKVLAGYGVERIDSVGQVFDPTQHEAIAVVPVTDPDRHNEVIDEWEPGYRMNDRILRVAKVRVARAPDAY